MTITDAHAIALSGAQKPVASRHIGAFVEDRWRLEAVVGTGGMANVFQARSANDELVAIKVMHDEAAASADLVEQFDAEARVMARLEHPNAVEIISSGRMEDQTPYLVMELLRGIPLDRLLSNRGGALEPDEALLVVDQALDIIGVCHEMGIVHRDIKPANLFVTSDGVVKVLDFGVARVEGEPDPAVEKNKRLGTPAYMSPEQALNAATGVDGRSDIFSMGAVLYALLSGRRIRDTESGDEAFILAATTPPSSLARAAPKLPLSVIRVVDRALAWAPDDRYQSAVAMSDAIRALLETGVSEEPDDEGSDRRGELLAALGSAVAQDDDALDLDSRREKLRITKDLFRVVAATFGTIQQYDWSHDQAETRRRQLFDTLTRALDRFPAGISWTVRPYGFDYGETPVWEPQHGTDDIPYNLFAGGFRTMRITAGMDRDELDALVRLMMTDPVRELAQEDDLGTIFLEQHFPHVEAQLVAAFDMDLLMDHADVQQEFADLRDAIREGLEQDFDDRASVAGLVAEVGEAGLKEADAIAISFDRGAVDQLAAPDATTVAADVMDKFRPVFLEEAGQHDGRTWLVISRALADARASGEPWLVDEPMVELVDEYVAERRADELIALFEGVLDHLDADQAEHFVATAATPGAMRLLADQLVATAHSDDPLAIHPAMTRIWAIADRSSYATLLRAFCATHGSSTADVLRDYVERNVDGGEAALGTEIETATGELADELVDLLSTSTRERDAHRALQQAARNPDVRVRVLALSHALSNPSEGVLSEVGALLGHKDAEARLATAELLLGLRVTPAVPKVLSVATDDAFHDRPLRERHVLLKFLFDNAMGDAERLAGDLARRHGLFGDRRIDPTRLLAVQLLGEYASSDEAADAVRAAAARVWWNPKDLREAAASAAEQIASRRGGA